MSLDDEMKLFEEETEKTKDGFQLDGLSEMYDCGHSFCLGCQLRMNFRCPLCKKNSKKIFINFSLRVLLQKLNPEAYETSKNIYEERQLERAFEEVSKNIRKEERLRLLKEQPEMLKRCCLIVFRYNYWVVEKKNPTKFKEFLKHDEEQYIFKEDIKFVAYPSKNIKGLTTLHHLFRVSYSGSVYIFF